MTAIAPQPSPLRFPWPEPPSAATLAEVAPGVRWLRMPLPFVLDHINLWLIEDAAGWTVIDTGIDMASTRAIWETVFAEALGGRKVTRLIVTHFHPDHLGLAGWLAERWQAPLWISETEWLYGRMASLDREPRFAADQLAFYRRAGLDAATLDMLAGRGNGYAERVSPVPRSFHRIADGSEIAIGGRLWRVVTGRGHAPEQSCLHCPELDLFIAGDQVLPKISPNVSVWPQEPDADPLSRFLDSLARLRELVPPEVLVLPSHNLPFYGLHARIDQLLAHHRDRLAEVEAACSEPASAMAIVPLLFRRRLDAHQLGFAVGEALAHLNYLVAAGRLVRRERADGVLVFERR